MDKLPKLEQLQEFEKFSFNKDEQQSNQDQQSNGHFRFNGIDLDSHQRYRFNSFENQNQLNEKDMTILQCLMQNDFQNNTEISFQRKRRKSSFNENYITENVLEISQQRKQSFPTFLDKEYQQLSNEQLFNEKKESLKDHKINQNIKTDLQQQNPKKTEEPQNPDKAKLNAKTIKVAAFWKNQTFFIPNVFRMIKRVGDSKELVFEIQDLSSKEVLIQSNGQKIKEMQ